MDNPFMKRALQRSGSSHGAVSEKRLSKALGARLTPASGAIKGAKGDMKLAGTLPVLLEAKSTTAATMKLEHSWLVKINHEAQASGSIPALAVSFVTPEGLAKKNAEWVLLPLHIFKELIET